MMFSRLLASLLKFSHFELQSADADKIANVAIDAALARKEAGEKFVVLELDGGIDGKAMQPLIKRVVKASGLPVLALSEAGGKVNCFALVPDDAASQLPANAWLTPVLAEVGGRGGGKPLQAQGSGAEIDGLPKAVEVAKSIAGEKLG